MVYWHTATVGAQTVLNSTSTHTSSNAVLYMVGHNITRIGAFTLSYVGADYQRAEKNLQRWYPILQLHTLIYTYRIWCVMVICAFFKVELVV